MESVMTSNILKPDIIALGSLVLGASIPEEVTAKIGLKPLKSKYNVSGTSIACPHVAGLAALLKAALPEWSITALLSLPLLPLLMFWTIHSPIQAHGNYCKYASPLDMRAGHINPNKALDPGLIYNATVQDYVNLLCSLNHTHRQILNITSSKIYNCSNPSSDFNFPSFFFTYNDTTSVVTKKFQRIVTNVGKGPTTYMVTVTAPLGSVVKSITRDTSVRKEVCDTIL
ncbi:unnamed protein product [Prunus armeniaca]|uniref:Subtilisin-like protease fibronectin type-III domain-containing protein n=1 Tax=Prunus armeniaca TaxID=36596 RepID=A0A6J5VUZ7_PRUAR|nr:unnamed protein product [Prunus armeniaca]